MINEIPTPYIKNKLKMGEVGILLLWSWLIESTLCRSVSSVYYRNNVLKLSITQQRKRRFGISEERRGKKEDSKKNFVESNL